jgi:hypothetical protein
MADKAILLVTVAGLGFVWYEGIDGIVDLLFKGGERIVGDAFDETEGIATKVGNEALDVAKKGADLVQTATVSTLNSVDNFTGGAAGKTTKYIGESLGLTGGDKIGFNSDTATKAGRAVNVAVLANPLTAPIGIAVALAHLGSSDQRKKLAECGNHSGWDRFTCGTKTFFGFA